jgi:predicted DNA-binding protein YlxM (UPF0122 family)
LQITEDRKKRVIDLYFNQQKSYAEVVQIERISPRDIHAIIKEEETRRQNYEHKQHQEETSSKTYKLFSEGKTSVQVATTLNLREPEVSKLYREYLKLKRLHKLYCVCTELGDEGIGAFLRLYWLMKEKGMSIDQVVNVVDIAIHKLPYMESLYGQAKDQAEMMQHTIQRLANNISAREYKISLLDAAAFSSEQECRRKEQQIQELTAEKDKIESNIALRNRVDLNNANG